MRCRARFNGAIHFSAIPQPGESFSNVAASTAASLREQSPLRSDAEPLEYRRVPLRPPEGLAAGPACHVGPCDPASGVTESQAALLEAVVSEYLFQKP